MKYMQGCEKLDKTINTFFGRGAFQKKKKHYNARIHVCLGTLRPTLVPSFGKRVVKLHFQLIMMIHQGPKDTSY